MNMLMEMIKLMKAAAGWGFGFLFIILAIGAIFSKLYASALACLLLAILIIPKTRSVIVSYIPLFRRFGINLTAIVLLVSIFLIDIGSYGTNDSENRLNRPSVNQDKQSSSMTNSINLVEKPQVEKAPDIVQSQTNVISIEQCAGIKDSAKRINCYDAAAKTVTGKQSQQSGSKTDKGVATNGAEAAYALCLVMESTGQTTQCEVGVYTVDVTIDTNGAEGRKICIGVADMMEKQTRAFAGKWKLRVFSPYSGERPIAVCTLK